MATWTAPNQTGPNELTCSCSVNTALDKVAEAVSRLGSVTEKNASQQYVQGKVKYGLNSVNVRVSVVSINENECRIVFQGSGGDVWGAASKNAKQRLIETLRNLDNPGYQVDRRGASTSLIVLSVIAIIVIVILVLRGVGLA